jgi:hypothetical protein
MRYISHIDSLTLLATSGKVKYQFQNGLLVIGSETGTGAGNEIVPDLAGTDPDSKMMILNAAGSTDLEKVGLNTQFWAAPPIVAAGTLASGSYYELIGGTVDLTGANYVGKYDLILPDQLIQADLTDLPLGTVIKATAAITVPAGTAKWALEVPIAYLDSKEHNLRSENFIINNLSSFKDESSWDNKAYGARTKDPKYVR